MILRFLRLFRVFRSMEEAVFAAAGMQADLDAARDEIKRLTTENQSLHDRFAVAIEDRKQMWQLIRQSIGSMETSYQAHVNVQWQKQGHGTPYPDAPHIPAAALPKVPDSDQQVFQRHELPSEMQARKTKEFMDEYTRRFAEALK